MKKALLLVLVGFLCLTSGANAQTTTDSSSTAVTPKFGYNGDHDGDGVPNYKDAEFLSTYKPAWANRPSTTTSNTTSPVAASGQQMGDGTKPQPRDGTGFGAQKKGRGQVYGTSQSSTGTTQSVSQGRGQRKGQGKGQGQGGGNGQRRRDGSCGATSSTSN